MKRSGSDSDVPAVWTAATPAHDGRARRAGRGGGGCHAADAAACGAAPGAAS